MTRGRRSALAAAVFALVIGVIVALASNGTDDEAANAALEKRRNVLVAAGLAESAERPPAAEIDARLPALRQRRAHWQVY